MSQSLRLLQLSDDLKQAFTEITQLRTMNDALLSEREEASASLNRVTVERDDLRQQCEDLRNVITLVDSGITDINATWRRKFGVWREREEELLRELEATKSGLLEQVRSVSHERDTAVTEFRTEKSNLTQKIAQLSRDNTALQSDITRYKGEIRDMADKLLHESKVNAHNTLISRDKEVLQEKVKVLEAKLNSFYEESIRQNKEETVLLSTTTMKLNAERDCDTIEVVLKESEGKIRKLEDTIKSNEEVIKRLKLDAEELSYQNESLSGTILQLRAQIKSNSESLQKSKNDKANLANSMDMIEELKSKVKSLKEVNKNLKADLAEKFSSLGQKEEEVEHLRSCFTKREEDHSKTLQEIGSIKQHLEDAENEIQLLRMNEETMNHDHTNLRNHNIKIKDENRILMKEIKKCQDKLKKLQQKFQEAGASSTRWDEEKLELQQQKIDLEVEVHELMLQIDEMSKENGILKEEIKALMSEMDEKSTVIKSREVVIDQLKANLNSYKNQSEKDILSLKAELEAKLEDFRNCRASLVDRSVSTLSIATSESWTLTDVDSVGLETMADLKATNHNLRRDAEMQHRKLAFAESRLRAQAAVLTQNKGDMEQLLVQLQNQEHRPHNKSRDNDTSIPPQLFPQQLAVMEELGSRVRYLTDQLEHRDAEVERLRAQEEAFHQREEQLEELSALVEQFQRDVDGRTASIRQEAEFYKSRLLEYERVQKVDRSMNTSLLDDNLIDELSSSLEVDNANVHELERVMENLRSTCATNLNVIENSFCRRLNQLDNCHQEKWISLVSK